MCESKNLPILVILAVVILLFCYPAAVRAGVTPLSDCCFVNGGSGCDNTECQDTVCGVDPYCCNAAWDSVCASEARDLCGDLCEVGPCELPTDHCPEAQQAAQDAVTDEGDYRNHGQYVKLAAKAANPYLKSGEISYECHSCIVNQFARSIPEGEQEDCFDFIPEGEACGDDTNGGCNSTPPEFGAIACGQTIAGTAWAYDGTRDTDWYLIELPDTGDNGTEMVTATLYSKFPGVNFVVDIGYPMCAPVGVGDIGCSMNGCPIQDASATLTAPGTYVIFVATGYCGGSGEFEEPECDGDQNDYVLSVECSDVAP